MQSFLQYIIIPFFSVVVLLAKYVAQFFYNYNLAKKFGQNPVGYGIGLTVLPYIFLLVFGFSKSFVYTDVSVSKFGLIEDKRQSQNINNQATNGNIFFCTNCGTRIIQGDRFCTNCGKEIH